MGLDLVVPGRRRFGHPRRSSIFFGMVPRPAVIGAWLFAEKPDAQTVAGAVLVTASAL